MPDLEEFLHARLAEDEAAARDARPSFFTVECLSIFASSSEARMVLRYDPARVLREIEAKRKILARCAQVLDAFGHTDAAWPDVTRRERAHADFTLCELAAVYSDHPDFDKAWVA